jgi:hypothetical protein
VRYSPAGSRPGILLSQVPRYAELSSSETSAKYDNARSFFNFMGYCLPVKSKLTLRRMMRVYSALQGSATTLLDTAAPVDEFHRPVAHIIYVSGLNSQRESCSQIVLLMPFYSVVYNRAQVYITNEEFVTD